MTNFNNAIMAGKANSVSVHSINGKDAMSFILGARDPSRTNQETGEPFIYNIPVSVRGPMVDRFKEKLTNGLPVLVSGRFEPYNTKKDGNTITRYQVNAQNLQLIDAGDIDTIILNGRLTADPEIRRTSNGSQVITFSIAVSRSYRGKDDEWKDVTSFITIIAWNDLAENFHYQKGDSIWVVGKLTARSYEDKNGNKRYPVEVVASQISSGGTGKRSNAGTGTSNEAAQPQKPQNPEDDFGDYSEVLDDEEDLPF